MGEINMILAMHVKPECTLKRNSIFALSSPLRAEKGKCMTIEAKFLDHYSIILMFENQCGFAISAN